MRILRIISHPTEACLSRIPKTYPDPERPGIVAESFRYTITVKEALLLAAAVIGEQAERKPGIILPELGLNRFQQWYMLFGSLEQRDINDLLHPFHFMMICQAYLEKRLELTGEWRRVAIIDDQNQSNEQETKA